MLGVCALKKIGGTFEALILVDPEQNHPTWMPFACQAQRAQQRASFSIYIVQRDIGQRPLFVYQMECIVFNPLAITS